MCVWEVVLPGPVPAVPQPACRAGLLLFLWLLDALQFGAWAPGSLGPWAFPVTHRVSDLLSGRDSCGSSGTDTGVHAGWWL